MERKVGALCVQWSLNRVEFDMRKPRGRNEIIFYILSLLIVFSMVLSMIYIALPGS
jgi:hypothetical protein